MSSRRFLSTHQQQQQQNQIDTTPSPPPRRRRLRRALWLSTLSFAAFFALTGAVLYASAQSPDAELAWGIARRVPLNALSRVAGRVSTWRIPTPFRRPIYQAYAAVYGVALDEAERPYTEYATLQEFFARRLQPGARLISTNGLASPVDGTVLHFGLVGPDHSLEQVKGSPFTLESFIGPHELAVRSAITTTTTATDENATVRSSSSSAAASAPPPHQLFYCTIYLAPGDYHGVHAPVSMSVDGRRHFPGLLLPVSPVVVSVLQVSLALSRSTNCLLFLTSSKGLFSLNERIVLFGRWRHGFFSLTPVGATNVGSIALKLEPHLVTNTRSPLRQPFYDRVYTDEKDGSARHVQAGDELAFFRLGSTVVMIFESPPFRFIVERGQKVKLGQLIGFTEVQHNNSIKQS